MKRWRNLCFLAVFALVLVMTFAFLRTFAAADTPMEIITWQSAARVENDGTLTPCDMTDEAYFTEVGSGDLYRFTTVVESSGGDSYLLMDTTGAELTVRLDGEEVLHTVSAPSYGAGTAGIGQVHIPLPPEGGLHSLETDFRLLSVDGAIYPPILRLTSVSMSSRFDMAYANYYGIPSGVFGLLFVLVCGMLLLEAALGIPDWSLLALALAAGLLTFVWLARGCGFYFLPESFNALLSWPGFELLAPCALLVYLLLNRKRKFWRALGQITLLTVLLLTLCSLISFVSGGGLVQYIWQMLLELFQYGVYERPLYWVTCYLIAASAAICALGLVNAYSGIRTETATMALKRDMAMESARAMEQQLQDTAALRHDWKNQLAALHMMQQEGDLEGIGAYLGELDQRLRELAPQNYTANFAINRVLQCTAARAEKLEIGFQVQVIVPPELNINEADLCVLLFNLLDNALEAAAQVRPPETRSVSCSIKLNQGFLAIRCKNSYAGPLRTDAQGDLVTTKADASGHGFGLPQIRAIVNKYHGMLDISYTQTEFQLDAALKPDP